MLAWIRRKEGYQHVGQDPNGSAGSVPLATLAEAAQVGAAQTSAEAPLEPPGRVAALPGIVSRVVSREASERSSSPSAIARRKASGKEAVLGADDNA